MHFAVYSRDWNFLYATFYYHGDALKYCEHNPNRYTIKEVTVQTTPIEK